MYSGTINSAGQVAGYSVRLKPLVYDAGRDTWFYDGSTTVQVGLTGAGYLSKNGTANSSIGWVSEAGRVTGTTTRYSAVDNATRGQDTWFYNGSNSVQIGLTGAGYTRQDGYAFSTIQGLSANNTVAGSSRRYSASNTTQYGEDAWIYDGSSTTRIGLIGAGYTHQSGSASSTILGMNKAGQVAGNSNAYDLSGTAWLGQRAWRYSGGTTVQIGLNGSGYTNQNGISNSSVAAIGESGHVAGTSTRYTTANNTVRGRDAWVFDGSSTVRIGLTGLGHTSQSGLEESTVAGVNNVGQVRGTTTRYSTSDDYGRGTDGWVFNGSNTVQVGLTGAGYTSQNGTAITYVNVLNDAGQAAGRSNRYDAANNNEYGESAWFFDGISTSMLGYTGAGYVSQNGTAKSWINTMSNSGLVLGASMRYSATDNVDRGRVGWLFDSTLDQLFDLTMDTRSDGYTYSEATYVDENGIVLGYYQSYDDATDALLGNRAFYFKQGEGLFDLGLLTSDLSLDGWSFLADAISVNGLDVIFGNGTIAGPAGAKALYKLTPSAVPVPASAWLMGSALFGLAGFARRKKSH